MDDERLGFHAEFFVLAHLTPIVFANQATLHEVGLAPKLDGTHLRRLVFFFLFWLHFSLSFSFLH